MPYLLEEKSSNGVIVRIELLDRCAGQETKQVNVVVDASESKAIHLVNGCRCNQTALANEETLLWCSIVRVPHFDKAVRGSGDELLVFARGVQADLVFHVVVDRGNFLFVGAEDRCSLVMLREMRER